MNQLFSSLAVRFTLVFAVMFLGFVGGFLIWYEQFRRDGLDSEVAAQVATLGFHMSVAISDVRRHEDTAEVDHLLRLAQGYRSIRCITAFDADGKIISGWPNHGCADRLSQKIVTFPVDAGDGGMLRIDYGGAWINETLREERLFVLIALGVALTGALLSALLTSYFIVQRRIRPILHVAADSGSGMQQLNRIAGQNDEIGLISRVFVARINAEKARVDVEKQAAIREGEARLSAQKDERNRLLASITESLSEGLLTHDLDLIIQGGNQAACRMFGYTSEELIGMHIRNLMPDDQFKIYHQVFAAYRLGHVAMPDRQITLTGLHRSGQRISTEVSFSETVIDGQRLFTGTLTDRTTERQARETVRILQNRLLAAIEAVPDAFVLYDSSDRMVVCNEKYRESYALSADLMVPGATFEEIVRGGAERGQYADAIGRVDEWVAERLRIHRDPPDDAIEQPLDDGRWLKITERRTPEGGTVGFRTDITELKQREFALQESEGRIRATIDAALDCIIIMDRHGAIMAFNPAAEGLFGYRSSEVIGKEMAQLVIPPHLRDAHRNGLAHYLVSGEGPVLGSRIEIEAMDRTGRNFPIELAISVAEGSEGPEFIGYIRDISERLTAERRIQDMARLPNENPAPVMRFDGRGKLLYANEASAKVATHLKVNVGDSLSGPWQERIYNPLASRTAANIELEVDDTTYSILLSPIPETQEVNLYGFDITELKHAEVELKLQRDRAEEANRAKSRFLAMMSHEIRTPLNAVLGVLGLLMDTGLNEEQDRFVSTGRSSAEALLTVINDILDFSKMEAGKLDLEESPFDPGDLARLVMEVLEPRARENGVALTLDADEDLPHVLLGDPGRLRQILLNFGSNAVRATRDGSVTFRIKRLGGTDARPTIRFIVEDDGAGVPEHFRDHLFSEFASAAGGHDQLGGTGLGLAICKRIIDAFDGEIGFDSKVGQGSSFWFEVTLERGSGSALTPSSAVPDDDQDSMERRREVRLLVAEDNPANQMVIRVMLEKAGFRIDIVGNGEEALRAMQQRAYQAVLMDVGMPVMDGLAATAAIRALATDRSTTPIIAMTAHVLDSEKSNILSSGMDDFVAKPIDRQHLINTVDRWVFKDQTVKGEAVGNVENHAHPVLDADVLERLAEETSTEVMPDIVRVYTQHVSEAISEFETALANSDTATLEAVAHRIGSSSGSLGAMRLFATCRAIEAAVGEGDPARSLALAADIRQLIEASIVEIEAYTRSHFGGAGPTA